MLKLKFSVHLPLLLDELLLRLDELRCCAHLSECFEPLGVAPALFDDALAHAAAVTLRFADAAATIDALARRYDAFWTFLERRIAALHANEGDPETGAVGNADVLAYVRYDLDTDRVLPLVAELPPLASPPMSTAPPSVGLDDGSSTADALRGWQQLVDTVSELAPSAERMLATDVAVLHATLRSLLAALPSTALRLRRVPTCSAPPTSRARSPWRASPTPTPLPPPTPENALWCCCAPRRTARAVWRVRFDSRRGASRRSRTRRQTSKWLCCTTAVRAVQAGNWPRLTSPSWTKRRSTICSSAVVRATHSLREHWQRSPTPMCRCSSQPVARYSNVVEQNSSTCR